MRTITMTAAVLKTIKSDADREIFAQMEGAEVPEDIVKDMASEPTYQGLFADNNHVIADLMINDSDETDTTNAQEGTTMTDTTTLTIAGFNLPPRTKGDRAYLGKEIPIGKASKALLVDLVAKLQEQPQSEPQPQPQQQSQQQSPQQPQLMELKRAYSAQLSQNQKTWLRKQTRSSVQFRELEPGRYQVRFEGFTPKSQQVLAGILERVCNGKDWYCKRQTTTIKGKTCVKHVYINMRLK